MIDLDQAIETVLATASGWVTGVEEVSLESANGRFIREDIPAPEDLPAFDRAAMDGYAVRSGDCLAGNREFIVTGRAYAGCSLESFEDQIDPEITSSLRPAIEIMTGAATPASFDRIVKIEDCRVQHSDGVTRVVIPAGESPSHIEPRGRLICAGETLIKKKTFVHSAAAHAAAFSGLSHLAAGKIPEAGVVSTGSELIAPEQKPQGTQIRDTNGYAVKAFLNTLGVPVPFQTRCPDDREMLASAIAKSLEYPLAIITGGVSAGKADYVPSILEELGVQKIFHKVAVKPGKPLWFGKNPKTGGLVFGLPGNPLAVSALLHVFVSPVVRLMAGGVSQNDFVLAPLADERVKKSERSELFPVKINSEGRLAPVAHRGSADVISVVDSSGLALHPAQAGKLEKNELVRFYLWR